MHLLRFFAYPFTFHLIFKKNFIFLFNFSFYFVLNFDFTHLRTIIMHGCFNVLRKSASTTAIMLMSMIMRGLKGAKFGLDFF